MADASIDRTRLAAAVRGTGTFMRLSRATGPLLLLAGLYATIRSHYLLGASIVIVAATLIVYALVSEGEPASTDG